MRCVVGPVPEEPSGSPPNGLPVCDRAVHHHLEETALMKSGPESDRMRRVACG